MTVDQSRLLASPSPTDILLVTLNSTYQHAAFGLRYLYAHLQEFQNRSKILEFTISMNTREMAEKILSHQPKIVGFGVYIWNTEETQELISILKKLQPDLTIVLGGPEVSFETESQTISKIADHIICGEADFLFYQFCHNFFASSEQQPKIIRGPLPDIQKIISPYSLYTDEDIRQRIIYVEASRGCPYKCEYCLSSLDKSVRSFPLEKFLEDMQLLLDRGVRQFKFVDRTFNLDSKTSSAILRFFLERVHLGLFLHFEMVPDRLPDELKQWIEKFPEGSLQFEIGIQTWSPEVAKNVSRRQNYQKIQENLSYLHEKTNVHTHADLIVGLPGETIDSFAHGFNELFKCKPHEIQVGHLKRLKGTPIIRHDQEFQMLYQEHPPFQILQNKNISFTDMQELAFFAKHWDLYANSGRFQGFIQWLAASESLFHRFLDFSRFLRGLFPESHGISLVNLYDSAWKYMSSRAGSDEENTYQTLKTDFERSGSRNHPQFLRHEDRIKVIPKKSTSAAPERQQRHLQ